MISMLESKLQNFSSRQFTFFIVALASVRVGISPIGKEWFGWLLDAARAFPEATTYISYSPLPVLLLKFLGTSNPYVWWVLWLLIDVSWIIFCLKQIKIKYEFATRSLQLIFMMSQSVMVNLTMIGHYDNVIFIAGTLLLFFERKSIYFISALLVAGANPYICLLYTSDLFYSRSYKNWCSCGWSTLTKIYFRKF